MIFVTLFAALLSRDAPHTRSACLAQLRAHAADFDRYVDMGVTLQVVRQSPTGTAPRIGAPKVEIIRTHNRGGVVDVKAGKPFLCAPSSAPVIWQCSEDQEQVLFHRDTEKLGQLVYGSEGAGKTTALAMWHVLKIFAVLGERLEGGQTAPTEMRMSAIRQELFRLCPARWYRYVAQDDLMKFCDGTTIRMVSTHRRSASAGSPIQGFNWSWCGQDEGQDQLEARDDIESRGRTAFNGEYHQLITATAKDDSAWRNTRDKLQASGLWQRRTMLGTRSPFVHKSFWEQKKKTMAPREYERRVLAQDVSIELAVYATWDRSRALRANISGADLTAFILRGHRSYIKNSEHSQLNLICCHDPGAIYNTTEIMRMMLVDGAPTWVVVGELQTKQTTQGAHAKELRRLLVSKFGTEAEGTKAAIFCDPHGKGVSDTDYQTVYVAFQKEGLNVFSPSEKPIRRSARIGMINRLLLDANNRTRLIVQSRDGIPVAPVLVQAFESLQKRDGETNPEGVQSKDEKDLTHAPAALGYGLWIFEQEARTAFTEASVITEARRLGVA